MFVPPSMPQRELTAQEKVTHEWDQMAGEWDDLAGGYATGFYQLLWESTGLDRADSRNLTIVDFGCGTGLLTEKLRAHASRILAVDASTKMVDLLIDKIRAGGWDGQVDASSVLLGKLGDAEEEARKKVEEFVGAADLIVASSALSFVPEEDIQETMRTLGSMLKPGGILCHTDWPKSEEKHPDGMDEEKVSRLYAAAGLTAEQMRVVFMNMGGEMTEVFVGVAKK